MAQPGSASGLGPEGRRFESYRSDHFFKTAPVRQDVSEGFAGFRVPIMDAKIYKPVKTAMQSGLGGTREWVLEFVSSAKRSSDPLMGWTSINDTTGQVSLHFDTREQAIGYAKREGLVFTVEEPRLRRRLVKSYSENFAADRRQPWTH